MFNSKKAARGPRSTTLVAKDTSIEGTLRYSGELDIEGQITGDIIGEADSSTTLNLLKGGRVDGEVRAAEVLVNGHVSGDVYALEQLHLASQAVVEGNVYYKTMEMERGAQVNGKLVHLEDVKDEMSADASKNQKLSEKAEAADEGSIQPELVPN